MHPDNREWVADRVAGNRYHSPSAVAGFTFCRLLVPETNRQSAVLLVRPEERLDMKAESASVACRLEQTGPSG